MYHTQATFSRIKPSYYFLSIRCEKLNTQGKPCGRRRVTARVTAAQPRKAHACLSTITLSLVALVSWPSPQQIISNHQNLFPPVSKWYSLPHRALSSPLPLHSIQASQTNRPPLLILPRHPPGKKAKPPPQCTRKRLWTHHVSRLIASPRDKPS